MAELSEDVVVRLRSAESVAGKFILDLYVEGINNATAADRLADIIRARESLARSEGYRLGQERMREAAAKATCPGCADEDYFPAESDPTRGMLHWSKDSYIGGGGRDYVRCRASLIAALPIEEEPQP